MGQAKVAEDLERSGGAMPLQRKRTEEVVQVTRVFSVLASLVVGAAAVFTTGSAGVAIAAEEAPAAESSARPHISTLVTRFQDELASSGYVSQPATEVLADLNRRYCEGDTFSAVWPNPLTPYLVAVMPEVPGQAPAANAPLSWRLRQDEAIVIIGVTPPPEAYYSIDLSMMRGPLQTGPVLWVAIGDPVNNQSVRTSGSTPYDNLFALVITGHRRTQSEVDDMLSAAGLGGATNDMTIPPAMFELGLDKDADEFLLGMRTAVPDAGYEAALDDYRATPPLQVFRVRPQSESADETEPVYAPDSLPVPPLRVSGTGTTELDLNPSLQLLRQRIIDEYPGYEAHDVVLERRVGESGPGLQANMVTDSPLLPGAQNASNDAQYLISPNISLPDDAFLVAYGTNHAATGKASYASVSVNADAEAWVSLATTQSDDLQGSAHDFIADDPNADLLYAWAFSRAGDSGPTGSHVTMLPTTDTDFCAQYGASRPVDMGTLQVVTRAYMEPATGSRPALSELLLDRALLFTPR